MTDNTKGGPGIELVNVQGGFWLRIGEDVYMCQRTAHKRIPIIVMNPVELTPDGGSK